MEGYATYMGDTVNTFFSGLLLISLRHLEAQNISLGI